MNGHSRRDFVRLTAMTAALGAVPGAGEHAFAAPDGAAPRVPFDLGIASYTFRSFPVEQAIAMTARLQVRKLTLKDMHLPMSITPQQMEAVREKMKAAGVELSSCGVVYMKTEEEVHKAFAYARLVGITMMVGVPEPPLLGLAEQKV